MTQRKQQRQKEQRLQAEARVSATESPPEAAALGSETEFPRVVDWAGVGAG